jgi:hypothetical protein
MKHFVATIRHHRFRLEKLPLSFAVALARNRPQPQLPQERGRFVARTLLQCANL